MAQSLTRYQKRSALRRQRAHQRLVEQGSLVVSAWHLGLEGTVLFGHRVLALEHLVAAASGSLLPVRNRCAEPTVDVVAPRAQHAMHRPDDELALACGL